MSRRCSTSTSSTCAATSSASFHCRRLLLVPPSTPLKRIMTTDLISVRTDTDQEEVARQVASYNLLAIPVVDGENKLAGIITVDDVIDAHQGRGDGRIFIGWPACRPTNASSRR